MTQRFNLEREVARQTLGELQIRETGKTTHMIQDSDQLGMSFHDTISRILSLREGLSYIVKLVTGAGRRPTIW